MQKWEALAVEAKAAYEVAMAEYRKKPASSHSRYTSLAVESCLANFLSLNMMFLIVSCGHTLRSFDSFFFAEHYQV